MLSYPFNSQLMKTALYFFWDSFSHWSLNYTRMFFREGLWLSELLGKRPLLQKQPWTVWVDKTHEMTTNIE